MWMMRIAPIYKRLPHGPHRLAHDEVIQNQRARIHGAMIEAIARDGYKKTSVKQVIGLAGVSRRSFYEQFANKEQCFLTSLDLIAVRAVKRTNEAFRAAEGDLENRLRVAFEQFTEEVGSDSKSAGLVIVEAPAAGAAGMLHLCRATGAFEQLLLSSIAQTPDVGALPLPVIRGIVGGLHEVISVRLRTGRAREIPALTEEMLRWTLLFGHSPTGYPIDPKPAEEDWPRAVRKAIGALMRQLADHPFHARMIAMGVYTPAQDVVVRNDELATLLTEGAPELANGAFTREGVTGAIWHTVRCQVAAEQIHRLPALTDHLAYVVLAPFIGTEAAAAAMRDDD
jgi:TetR/AcrR family transcriptional regulator